MHYSLLMQIKKIGLLFLQKGNIMNQKTYEERKALVKSYLGNTVLTKIDRPIGYVHKKVHFQEQYNKTEIDVYTNDN